MTPTTIEQTPRERITRHILGKKGAFIAKDIFADLPKVPQGTISALISALTAHRALSAAESQNGARSLVYQVPNPRLATLEWAALRGKLVPDKRRTTPRRRRRIAARPVTAAAPEPNALAAIILEWQRKAKAYDRLVLDLGFTAKDLAEYQA